MKNEHQNLILRSHLLRMAMLSNRAVDYSIKSYEYGDPEFGRLARRYESEWVKTQSAICERGRMLIASGIPIDAESSFARHSLQTYSALRITYLAAAEIAHNSLLLNEKGQTLASNLLRPMGRFANGLVGLYTVALFNMEVQHTRTILRNEKGRHWFFRSLNLIEKNFFHQGGVHARLEFAIARSLGQIADQAYEIAGIFTSCVDSSEYHGGLREQAA
jgi:hypothetical protein